MAEKNNKYEGMSASKAKRERIKDERAKAKRDEAKGIAIAVVVVIAKNRTRRWLPLTTAQCSMTMERSKASMSRIMSRLLMLTM